MIKGSYKIILKNAAVLTAGRFFSRILQFFLFIYAARCLGVNYFGIFSFAYVLIKILEFSMDMGLENYTVQQVSRNLEMVPIYQGASLTAKIFLIIVGYALAMGIGFIMGKNALTMKALFILATAAAFESLSQPFTSVFRAHEKMEYSAAIISISNCIMTIIGFALLYYYKNVLLFCFAITIGAFLRLILSALWCSKKYGMPLFAFDFSFIFFLLKKSFPFVAGGVFVTLYYYADTVILDIFKGNAIVAYYNAAYRLVEAPLFVSDSIRMALFPAISRLYIKNVETLNSTVSQFFNKGFALGASIALVIAFLSKDIISFIYGLEYSQTASVLPILIFSVAIIMPSTICGTTIRATDRQSIGAVVTGAGMLLNIILNLLLIPKYSYLGAAWATLATELAVLIVYIKLVQSYIGSIVRVKAILQTLMLNSLLLIFLYFAKPAGFWVQSIGCCVIFFPCTFITGVLEMNVLKQMLLKKRKQILRE